MASISGAAEGADALRSRPGVFAVELEVISAPREISKIVSGRRKGPALSGRTSGEWEPCRLLPQAL